MYSAHMYIAPHEVRSPKLEPWSQLHRAQSVADSNSQTPNRGFGPHTTSFHFVFVFVLVAGLAVFVVLRSTTCPGPVLISIYYYYYYYLLLKHSDVFVFCFSLSFFFSSFWTGRPSKLSQPAKQKRIMEK
ncbi:hypothetical protein DFH11DRAFT_99463 [Phellopilus nigrolimitatus]|nr:hypothetical protein DFH11DRAFT_99463 [Phellopilus nigrolimitatus]